MIIYIPPLEEEGHFIQHQVLKKFYKKHGKFKAYFSFQSFELIALFSGKLGRKEKDL